METAFPRGRLPEEGGGADGGKAPARGRSMGAERLFGGGKPVGEAAKRERSASKKDGERRAASKGKGKSKERGASKGAGGGGGAAAAAGADGRKRERSASEGPASERHVVRRADELSFKVRGRHGGRVVVAGGSLVPSRCCCLPAPTPPTPAPTTRPAPPLLTRACVPCSACARAR
jgi:hypothetical protein